MNVSFHPAAAAEVERAQAWYEERSVFAATGFLQELPRAVQRIRLAPARHPAAEFATRRILLEQYPFSIFYIVRRDEVDIWLCVSDERVADERERQPWAL